MNVEGSAAILLQRGVELDTQKRYTEALICYQEGIQILVDAMKSSTGDKKAYLRVKVEEYMNRAELIKEKVIQLKEEGKYHEQINIGNNSTGHSYECTFGRFLDENVKSVKVEDAYIRSVHQCQNFTRFCELIVKKCKNAEKITLVTSKGNEEQEIAFNLLSSDLRNYKIYLEIVYSNTLHDRQITLSSGWIIKIGRGLDYFKPPENRYSLGFFDLKLRKCNETTVDIFHSKNIKQKF